MYICTWLGTDDPNDAFWLAQTFFMTHQYSRAERLLTRPFSTATSKYAAPDPPVPNGHGYPLPNLSSIGTTAANAKGKGKEMPLPSPVPRLPMGPGGMIEVPEEMQEGVSRLVDMSVACRYLAAQCQVCVCWCVRWACIFMHYTTFRWGKEIGQRQRRCLERQIHSETLVNQISSCLNFIHIDR